ncbi:HesA/MoeB/ThiF family protein [Deinococcus sonorensis]|uniref:HesA/MoeB/ThiF family protein n=2 Tax=Deinococcus sonorensis TaxID=309891 RepID=A0AAU7UDI7_9DEIO
MTQEPLSRDELRRYGRALLVPEWAEGAAQERLRAASVLVVGAGGLGSPVVQYLSGAGVGRLGIADSDTVSVSNLHRQTLYTTADVGHPKAQVAAARAQQVNPHVQVEPLPALDPTNAATLGRFDLTLDCTDNFEARYLINDTCVQLGRRWVWGAAGGSEGMVSVFGPDCTLRSVFPTPDGAESCETIGVLGPLLGVIASLMSAEALKLLGGVGQPLEGQLLTYDLMSGRFRRIGLRTER